jgi:hypothetical protein
LNSSDPRGSEFTFHLKSQRFFVSISFWKSRFWTSVPVQQQLFGPEASKVAPKIRHDAPSLALTG